MVFKNGERGLGYYEDEKTAAPAAMRKMEIAEVDSEEEEEVVIKRAEEAPAATEAAVESSAQEDEVLDDCAREALERASQIREEGNTLFSNGQYEQAMDKYAKALASLRGKSRIEESLAAKCLNNRAACACQLQLYSEAVSDTSRVLEKIPGDLKALMRRGFAYEALERSEVSHSLMALDVHNSSSTSTFV